MSPSAFNLNGFRGEAALRPGAELGHAAASPLIENQLSSPADIGKAHQFFQPGAQAQLGNAALGQAAMGKAAIGNAALGTAAIPGADVGSLTGKALQIAQAQVSPIIQLIMRMPGHIGLMSSAFEAFAAFFTHHATLIGGLDPSLLGAAAHGDIGAQFAHAAQLCEHIPLDLHILPHDAPFLHDLAMNHIGMPDGALTGGEHGFDLSYVNDHLFSHDSLNVSGTLNAAKPQFEGLSFNDPHGELISGPSLSHGSPATHLADDKSLLLEKGFNAGHAGNPSNSMLSSASTPTTPAVSQPLSFASSGSVPSSLHVGSSAFGAQPSAAAAVGNLGTADGGSSLSNALGSHGADSGSFGPSGAVGDKLGGQQLLAMNKTGDVSSTGTGSEYGANFIKSQPSGHVEGLKAKELTLESVNGHHKLADAAGSHGNALDKLHKQAHEVGSKHATTHAHKAVSSSKPSSPSNTTASSQSQNQVASTDAGADTGAAPADGADANAAPADYKIQSGDCLWNIAKDKLGDATKWSEIFKLNSDTLGSNPSMIHPGATIHLPGQSLAHHAGEASKYVVKSGDNLWNISKNNLGDATKWGEVYKLNHELIGSNPGLIQPGTELTLPGTADGAGGQLADASAGTTAAPGLDAAGAPAGAAPDQVAQAVPDTNAPAAFGHPNGSLLNNHAEAPAAGPTGVAETHLPPQSLEQSLPPSGAATAAPAAVGPGAAGAATLAAPIPPPQVPAPPVNANSPENASVVSSSVGNDLANFLSRKK